MSIPSLYPFDGISPEFTRGLRAPWDFIARMEELRSAPKPLSDDDACGTDQSDPGPFRSDVFVSIKVAERPDAPGLYTATSDDFTGEYGDGDSPYEALQDFFGRVADHMAFLAKYEPILTDSLRSELDYFRYISGDYERASV